jgi:hypothetical protein
MDPPNHRESRTGSSAQMKIGCHQACPTKSPLIASVHARQQLSVNTTSRPGNTTKVQARMQLD